MASARERNGAFDSLGGVGWPWGCLENRNREEYSTMLGVGVACGARSGGGETARGGADSMAKEASGMHSPRGGCLRECTEIYCSEAGYSYMDHAQMISMGDRGMGCPTGNDEAS